jgi:hypothetical protein
MSGSGEIGNKRRMMPGLRRAVTRAHVVLERRPDSSLQVEGRQIGS